MGEINPKDYPLGKMLGEGRFSRVYLSAHQTSGEIVAVKVLDKADVKRLAIRHSHIYDEIRGEIECLRQTDHPNVIRLVGVAEDRESWYRVFAHESGTVELLEVLKMRTQGQSASSELEEASQCDSRSHSDEITRPKHGTLTEAGAKHVLAQLVNALKHLHDKAIMHRDIKPENIVITPSGRAMLIDFGTAVDGVSAANAKSFVGTPQYMAPEIIDKGRPSPEVDLWALGCVAYQMLVGCNAFEGGSEFLTMLKVQAAEYDDTDVGMSEEATDFVRRLLVKSPGERLGAGGRFQDIKSHPFFSDIDFSVIHSQSFDLVTCESSS